MLKTNLAAGGKVQDAVKGAGDSVAGAAQGAKEAVFVSHRRFSSSMHLASCLS